MSLLSSFSSSKTEISGVELHLPTEEMSPDNRRKINISRRKPLSSRDFSVKIFKGQSKQQAKQLMLFNFDKCLGLSRGIVRN
jgi:hypothetical protein